MFLNLFCTDFGKHLLLKKQKVLQQLKYRLIYHLLKLRSTYTRNIGKKKVKKTLVRKSFEAFKKNWLKLALNQGFSTAWAKKLEMELLRSNVPSLHFHSAPKFTTSFLDNKKQFPNIRFQHFFTSSLCGPPKKARILWPIRLKTPALSILSNSPKNSDDYL